jgi:hypothetical protein
VLDGICLKWEGRGEPELMDLSLRSMLILAQACACHIPSSIRHLSRAKRCAQVIRDSTNLLTVLLIYFTAVFPDASHWVINIVNFVSFIYEVMLVSIIFFIMPHMSFFAKLRGEEGYRGSTEFFTPSVKSLFLGLVDYAFFFSLTNYFYNFD